MSAALPGLRLPMLLALLALFSLAILGSWHDMHPDLAPPNHAVHGTGAEQAAGIDSHDATGHPDYLDHVASHAGLHAIGLPAFPTTVHSPLRPIMLWHAAPRPIPTSIDPAQDLRPPRS